MLLEQLLVTLSRFTVDLMEEPTALLEVGSRTTNAVAAQSELNPANRAFARKDIEVSFR